MDILRNESFTHVNKKFVYFKGQESWFSNFNKCTFHDLSTNQTFQSVEQYFQYMKSITFKDYDTAKKIMMSSNPFSCKQLGKTIKDFNPTIWNQQRNQIMMKGLKLKFSIPYYNDLLRIHYIDKNNQSKRTFVEISQSNYWGCKIDVLANNSDITLYGKNTVGFMLTQVAEEFFKNDFQT